MWVKFEGQGHKSKFTVHSQEENVVKVVGAPSSEGFLLVVVVSRINCDLTLLSLDLSHLHHKFFLLRPLSHLCRYLCITSYKTAAERQNGLLDGELFINRNVIV